MNIEEAIQAAGDKRCAAALKKLLLRFVDPAFGALPKTEIEMLMLNALQEVGAVSDKPEVYELVSKLRVTRTKARRLIYESELRRSTVAELDERVKDVLRRPIVQKAGDQFILEVENPLVSDHLRARVQKLGFASDGSFSPSIVKLPLDAVTALVESYLNKDEVEKVRLALVKAGAPDTSFRGVMKALSRKLAERMAAETGEAVMHKATELMSPILDAAAQQVAKAAKGLFKP